MSKWPALEHWSLPQLLRLHASWREIMPENAEQRASLDASLHEVEALIEARLLHAQQPRDPA